MPAMVNIIGKKRRTGPTIILPSREKKFSSKRLFAHNFKDTWYNSPRYGIISINYVVDNKEIIRLSSPNDILAEFYFPCANSIFGGWVWSRHQGKQNICFWTSRKTSSGPAKLEWHVQFKFREHGDTMSPTPMSTPRQDSHLNELNNIYILIYVNHVVV